MAEEAEVKSPVQIDPEVRGGDPCIQGQRIPVSILLRHLLTTLEKHRMEHPEMPYDLACQELWRATLRGFCDSYPSVSQDNAGEALGFTLLALARLALDRPTMVLLPAIERALKKEVKVVGDSGRS